MAVVGTARQLSAGRRGSDDEDGAREYVRTFGVIVDDPHDDAKVVLSAPGIPIPGQQYITTTTSDLSARVTDREADPDDKTRLYWRVTIVYSNQYDAEALHFDEGPLAEPPDIQHESETYDVPLPGVPTGTSAESENVPQTAPIEELVDAKPKNNQSYVNWKGGRGVTNSAGWPYNPPPTQQESRPVITFTRNEVDYTLTKKVRFENSVNSKPWNGLHPRMAWCRSITAQQYVWKSPHGDPDVYYYRVTYTFVIKWESWDLQLLDYGWYYLKWRSDDPMVGGLSQGEVPVIKTFSTNDGDPVFGLLDNSDHNKPGRKLANGGEPKFNIFPTRRQQDFNLLGINLNLNLQNIRTRFRNKIS